MTDQDLIKLLQEKPPREFTTEEFEQLRARWTQSPELRQALIEHLHLESQLAGGLGQVDVNIEAILRRAVDERRQRPGRSTYPYWVTGLLLLIALGIGVVQWNGRPQEPVEVADLPQRPAAAGDADPAGAIVEPDPPADALDAIAARQAAAPMVEGSTTVPTAVPIVVAENEPWSTSLAIDTAPWPPRSPGFTADFRTAGHDQLTEADARRWFSAVDGQPFHWGQDTYGNQPQRRVARFQGLARLRAPWPDDALLRVTPFEINDLTVYLWRGPRGVALRYYTRREPHLWAAFEIQRETSTPKPTRWGLLTTDNGAYLRSGTGTFDLRWQDGTIVLSRGGIPLLTAPISGRPEEVLVEGQFRLRGISIHRSAPLPSLPDNPHPVVVSSAASSLEWVASAETPAELTSAENGRVVFRSDSAEKQGTVVLPLDRRGLYEVIARIDAADPGTGLFLGDLDGRPLHRVAFFKDNASGQVTVGVLRPGENREQAQYDFNAFPPPYQTAAQWIRVIAGLGTVQIQVSGDGRHWGHLVENPARDLPGAVGSVGMFGLPAKTPRSLTLAHLEVRELSGLANLVDHDLAPQVPRYTSEDWKDHVRWSHTTMEACPPDVELPRWLRTCVARSLAEGPPREFAVPALRRLVQNAILSDIPLDQKQLLLDEAALLSDVWEESSARALADHYLVLAQQRDRVGDSRTFETLFPAIIRSSLWTSSKLKFAWERQVSHDLISAACRGDWPQAWQASHTAQFWTTGPHPDFVPTERAEIIARQARWVRAMAIENTPQLDDGQSGLIPPTWRHPLALQWNKEAYNVRAELQSALTGQSYEDACRIVMSINVTEGPGLLPDMEDRQLFVSLPTAVAAAMQTYPAFEQLMVEKFGPLGTIRVRQGIQSGDVRGVQAATLQFFGTEAAAEAHTWLGDRDLAAGRFPSAEEHFLLALAQALPRQRDALKARLQLARALNGAAAARPEGMETLEWNGTRLSGAELETLFQSLAQRPSLAQRFQPVTRDPAPVLPPRAYRVEQRAVFDGQSGQNPGKFEFRHGDPFGRQLASLVDAQRIYVSNRFQVNAYQHSGQQVWAQSLGSDQGEAYAMPMTPMPPLLAGDRMFVRRLAKGGAELACLKTDSGQVLWAQRPNLQVISDPVFWNGSLCALTLARFDDDHVQVEATRFDFESGAATSSQPLFRLRDGNDRSHAAQLVVSGRLAVCTLAGISCCFDGSGEIHWLRRHLWIPGPVDELSEDFRVAAPILQGRHVVVSVPGVREICAMDLETGRLVWKQSEPDLRGIAAVHDSLLLLDTARGLVALELTTGRPVWKREFDSRLEAIHVHEPYVVVAQRHEAGSHKTRPVLIWLDLATGVEVAESQIVGQERPECQMGPLIPVGGKWWAFVGQGWKETRRELVELIEISPQVPGVVRDAAVGDWLPDLAEPHLADLAYVLPGWHPEANYGSRMRMEDGDQRGEKFVISSKLDVFRDVRLFRRIDVPVGKKCELRLRFGNLPGKRWKLTVRVAGQTLLEQIAEDAGSSNGWRDAVIDLTPLAGRRVTAELIQSLAPKDTTTDALIKQAALVIE